MDKSKIENLDPSEYTHLPHAAQDFEGHEQTDVAIRPLVATLVAIAVVIVVSGIGMWGLFKVFYYVSQNSSDNQNVSNVPPAIRRVPEGQPALQGVPAKGANPNMPSEDMDEMRKLNSLKLAGRAPMRDGIQPGMPIDEAMDKALASGTFKTAAKPGGGNRPTTGPTASAATVK
jgi:hypothetical protein